MATKKISKVEAKEAKVIKTIDDLRQELTTKQKELLDAKQGHKRGELVNPRIIGTTRKQIARLHTAIRANMIYEAKESK